MLARFTRIRAIQSTVFICAAKNIGLRALSCFNQRVFARISNVLKNRQFVSNYLQLSLKNFSTSAIVDVNMENFQSEVLDSKIPVIVDFHAEWCGPCKKLGPILETVVKNSKGKLKLVKIDVDQNQEISAQLQVQSVPTVFAFVNGRPVSRFNGNIPQKQVEEFAAAVLGQVEKPKAPEPAPVATSDEVLDEFDVHEIELDNIDVTGENAAESATAIKSILTKIGAKKDIKAINIIIKCHIGLCKLALSQGHRDVAKSIILSLSAAYSPEIALKSEFQSTIASLELKANYDIKNDEKTLLSRISADGSDLEAYYELSILVFGKGDCETGLNHALTIVKKDKTHAQARALVLQYLSILGPTHQLSIKGRLRLTNLIFS